MKIIIPATLFFFPLTSMTDHSTEIDEPNGLPHQSDEALRLGIQRVNENEEANRPSSPLREHLDPHHGNSSRENFTVEYREHIGAFMPLRARAYARSIAGIE
ncbi:MAG: hypothetical protein LBC91_01030 [Candidatus Accumulibacter sp.]|jgi:hypothetical protein|nr:hypothetical protein [Accumulibacter sp.]